MTRLAYELTQFVNDLKTITAEMRDPRASLVRVPRSGEHMARFSLNWSKASPTVSAA